MAAERPSRLSPCLLLAVAACAGLASGWPGPAVAASSGMPAGRHCFATRDSNLKLTVRGNGTAAVDVYSGEANGHVCGLQGEARAVEGGFRITETIDGEGQCRLDILVAGNGNLQFKDRGYICRLRYCGARASLDELTFKAKDKKPC